MNFLVLITKNLQNGIVSQNAIRMVKDIMKKLKVKSVNTSDGKPNIKIDLEFIKNKKNIVRNILNNKLNKKLI